MAGTTEKEKQKIKDLLNNLNLGTQKAEVGEVFVAMLDRIEELEARVDELEGDGA